ncbi:MAG: lipopolysaccharide biosynthesis protein [Pseudonocardia sp.]
MTSEHRSAGRPGRGRRRHQDPDVSAGLAGVARRGAAVSAVTLVLVQVISLASTLAIARVLSPQEVGLYAAGTILSGFLVIFAAGGMKVAIVQRQEDVEDAADSAFYATVGTGLLVTLAALAAAPLVGRLFGNPEAGTIAAVTCGMLLMQALTNVPDGLMMRRFNLRRRLIIDPLRSATFGVVTIVFAVMGYGVWSLVIGNYASMAVWLVGTWALARWRPGLGTPSWRLWRELARFSYPLIGWGLSFRVREAVQTALLGRGLGEAALGQYRYGKRLGELPSQAVVQVGSFVILPAFSRMIAEPERFRRAFFRSLRVFWLAAVPLSGMLLAFGQSAVVVLLGEQWAAAGDFLVAMSLVGALVALQQVAGEAIKAAGRSKLLHHVSVVELVFGIGLVAALLPFGLLGVGLAVTGTALVQTVVMLVLARPVVGFRGRDVVRALVPGGAAAALAVGLLGPLEWFVARAGDRSIPIGLLLLAGLSIAFALVYLLALRLFDPALSRELAAGIRRFVARRRDRGAGPGSAGVDASAAATDATSAGTKAE